MSKIKISLMLAGAAFGSSLALPQASFAQPFNIHGGGASLPAGVARRAFDCYGEKVDLRFIGNPITNPPAVETLADFNFTGTPAFDCATAIVSPGRFFYYISTGSGRGIAGIYSNSTTFWGDTTTAAEDGGTNVTVNYPRVDYALSETSLSQSNVNVYNNGGTVGSGSSAVTVTAPNVAPGVGQFKNPRQHYGPLIQFPLVIAPVTIAYDPVYRKVRDGGGGIIEYKYNINPPRVDGSGGLRLNREAYCGMFNGVGPNNQGNNWNVGWLRSINNATSLKDPTDPTPFSVDMQIVGRSDSSGTTSLWTRHLAAVCAPFAYNVYADSTTTLPAGLIGGTYNKTLANDPAPGEVIGKYTIADGNDGVAKYLDFTREPGPNPGDFIQQGRVGYLSPDFALPAAAFTGVNTFGLNTANVRNQGGAYQAPTPGNASNAFAVVAPPESDAAGNFVADPNPLNPQRENPWNWVEPASKLSPLANPAAGNAYPIVGSSNFLGYTCYRSANFAYPIRGFLDWFTTQNVAVNLLSGGGGVVARSGFGPLPLRWRRAIKDTFVTGAAGLPLRIIRKSDAPYCNDPFPAGITGPGA
jgi:phosphate transport system substrate-binding protein